MKSVSGKKVTVAGLGRFVAILVARGGWWSKVPRF